MEASSVHLAAPADSRAIWEIRFLPEVNITALQQEYVPFKQHNTWFLKKYFSDLPNYCFVLKNKIEKVVGYCRFDESGAVHLVSIALLPSCQGKGLGKKLLTTAIGSIRSPMMIEGVVKQDNAPSLALFQSAGFNIYRSDAGHVYLSKKI